MYSHSDQLIITVVTAVFLYHCLLASCGGVPFDNYYYFTYGTDHARFLNKERTQFNISLDKINGAGFGSKQKYGSGLFEMWIKHPPGDTAGVVTTFYLRSGDQNTDELDFEFMGNKPGIPVRLQTNVFTNGVGDREERMRLWFNPSQKYHSYRILWNHYHIVFYVDLIPIRIFKKHHGVGYPSKPLQVLGSVWNGGWASKDKINWSHAPFTAQYFGFGIGGCVGSPDTGKCNSLNYWWNKGRYFRLYPGQLSLMKKIRRKYLTYTYCTNKKKHPLTPPECYINN